MTTVTVNEVTHTVTVTGGTVVVVSEPVTEVVEVSTAPALPLSLVFKTANQTNSTTTLVDDTELRFLVAAGHKYSFILTYFMFDTNNVFQSAGVSFTAGAGITILWQFPDDTVSGIYIMRPKDFLAVEVPSGGDITAGSGGHAGQLVGTVDAVSSGEVIFQFRQGDSNTTGGVTVLAGSMMQVFEVA